MLRKTAHWQKPCQSLGETRNLWIHPLQGRVSNRVGVFSTEPPHIVRGLGGAEVRSCTIHILPTGKRANTTEVCSPQTSADQARAPTTTNRKSPPRSGKPNRRSLKTVTNTPRAQPKQTRTTFTDGYAYSTCPPPHWRPPSLLHGQLGGSLQRPMGFGSGKVIQDRVYLRTKTKRTTWPNCHERGTVPGHDSRNSRAPQERSGGAGGFSQRGVCKPSVPGAQVRWRMETSPNLKSLNQFVVPHHFKMESIRTLEGVLQKDDWLLKLDLKDAYLSIPIHQNHQHFLRFPWKGQLWQFKALPFGLSSAPWVFTKVTKPISSILRKLGIWLILYLERPSYSVDINPLNHKNENRFTVNQLLSQRKRYLAHMFNTIRVEQKPVPSTFDCTSEVPDALRQHSQFAHSTQPAFLSCSFKRSELVAVGSEKEP